MALALAEIDRLKAIMTRITDGREIVFIPGDNPGVDEIPPVAVSGHVLYGGKHTRAFQVTAAAGVSLIVNIQQGQAWIGGTFFTPAELTLLMTDDTTNFVFLNAAGAVATNTTSFPEGSVPLAEVVTAAGDITAVNDRRSYLSPGAAASGAPHDADQIIDDDSDTGIEVERGGDDDTIRLRAATVDVALIAAAGQWQLPIIGAGAGLLIGGDVLLYRSAANILQTPDSVHIEGDLEIDGDLNHDGSNLGVFGVVPVARAGAYTQTFATADKTHALDGSNDMPAGGVGIAAGGWDTAANRDTAIAEFAALRVTVDDLKQLMNAVIDDLQAYGLFQ